MDSPFAPPERRPIAPALVISGILLIGTTLLWHLFANVFQDADACLTADTPGGPTASALISKRVTWLPLATQCVWRRSAGADLTTYIPEVPLPTILMMVGLASLAVGMVLFLGRQVR